MSSVSPGICGLDADVPDASLDDNAVWLQCLEQTPSSAWRRRRCSTSAWSARGQPCALATILALLDKAPKV